MRRATGVCLILLAITACSTKRSYLDKGNSFFNQGKYQDAAINYRKAIQKDANYGEAYYRLGLAAQKLGTPVEAYDSLFRASQLLSNNLEVKQKFADLCLEYYLRDLSRPQKLYQQIQQAASEFLSQNPRSFEGLRLEGYLAHEDRKSQDAVSYFQKALQVQPWNAAVTTALAQTLMETGRSQEAEKLALELIAREKTYGPTYDVLYSFYFNANRVPDAENILKLKVANNPKQASYILQLASHYARVKKPMEVSGTLQKLLDDPKEFPNAQLRIGDFYLSEKDYPNAIRYYQTAAGNDPKARIGLEKRELGALLVASKYDEASRLIDKILTQDPQDEVALRIRADLLIGTQKAENAAPALQILQNLLSNHPSEPDPALRFQLGRAYRLKGDLGPARAEFEEAVRQRKDFALADVELGEIGLMQQRPADALVAASAALALQPSDRRARLLQARSLAGTGDAVKARAVLSQLIKESPKDTAARTEMGLLSLQQANYREAADELEDLRAGGDPRVLTGLATAYASQRQFDKAVAVLSEGLKQSPDSVTIQEKLAWTSALAGDFGLATAQFQQLIAKYPKSADLRLRLAEVYRAKGETKNALQSYREAHDLVPDDATTALVFADALTQAGQTDEARALYLKIVKSHPDNLPALNNAAFFLCDSGGDLNEAQKLVEKALSKAPGQPGFTDTLAYVLLKKGQRDTAIRTFSDLVRRYPSFGVYHYHLGMALYEKGDAVAARKELQRALASHPGTRIEPRIKALLAKV